jgi:uncharacterized protein (DUF1810 family)
MGHDLDRFLAAQASDYGTAVRELTSGRKKSHWIWSIFPQVAGLGSSWHSQRYAIRSLDEARAYLTHPVLGPRLRECAGLVLAAPGRTADDVMGSSIDARKLRSSMTLFHRADPSEALFRTVLERYFEGVPDDATDAILSRQSAPQRGS